MYIFRKRSTVRRSPLSGRIDRNSPVAAQPGAQSVGVIRAQHLIMGMIETPRSDSTPVYAYYIGDICIQHCTRETSSIYTLHLLSSRRIFSSRRDILTLAFVRR